MDAESRSPWLTDLPEVRLGLAEAALLVAATLCVRLGADVRVGQVVLAVAAGAACLALPPRYAVVVGLSAWAFLTGFVVNAGGQLTLGAADLQRMGVLVTAVLLAATLPAFIRRARAVVAHGRARPVAAPHA